MEDIKSYLDTMTQTKPLEMKVNYLESLEILYSSIAILLVTDKSRGRLWV